MTITSPRQSYGQAKYSPRLLELVDQCLKVGSSSAPAVRLSSAKMLIAAPNRPNGRFWRAYPKNWAYRPAAAIVVPDFPSGAVDVREHLTIGGQPDAVEFSIFQETRVAGARSIRIVSAISILATHSLSLLRRWHGRTLAEKSPPTSRCGCFGRFGTGGETRSGFAGALCRMPKLRSALADYAQRFRLVDTPRTTGVACVVQDDAAYWAHAGDSRLYHIREGSLQTTRPATTQSAISARQRHYHGRRGAHPDANKVFSCLAARPSQQSTSHREFPCNREMTFSSSAPMGFWSANSDGELVGANQVSPS